MKKLEILLIVIITLLINLIWLGISANHLSEIREGVNEKEQVKYIITNPIGYCNADNTDIERCPYLKAIEEIARLAVENSKSEDDLK